MELKPLWSDEDRENAHLYGWDIFENDNWLLTIDYLDDPYGVCQDFYKREPLQTFWNQDDFQNWIKYRVLKGDPLVEKALQIVAGY